MPTMRGCWPNTNHPLPKLGSLENRHKSVFSHVLIVVRIQCNKPSQGRNPCVFTNHHSFLPIHSFDTIILSIFYGPGIGQGAEISVVYKSFVITVLVEFSQCSTVWRRWGRGNKGMGEKINKVNIQNCVK